MIGNPHAKTAPLLQVEDVSVRFGGIVALDGVSFNFERGQILGLIGPNGAGKTTLFNCLSRLYQPSNGDIIFEGQSVLCHPAHAISSLGIARTFQNVALFHYHTVLDNVLVGAHPRGRSGIITDALTPNRGEEKTLLTRRGDHPRARPRRHRRPDGDGPALRHSEAGGDGARARRQTQAAAARRARRRPQSW